MKGTKVDGYILNLKMCYNDIIIVRDRLERTMVAAVGEMQEDEVDYLQRKTKELLEELSHAISVAS